MNNQNNPNEKPGQGQGQSGKGQDQQGQQRMQEQQQRQGGGMADLSQLKEHMEVVGSDGAKVGTVDKVEGNRIKLTKDSSGGGEHRYIEASSVAEIRDGRVCLSDRTGGVVGNG